MLFSYIQLQKLKHLPIIKKEVFDKLSTITLESTSCDQCWNLDVGF